MTSITYSRGSECNPVKIGGVTTLHGDKTRKPEKPYTIINFPGGSLELSRIDDGENAGCYWVHIATHGEPGLGEKPATIIEARIDCKGQRYCDAGNSALTDELAHGDVNHIAFLVRP